MGLKSGGMGGNQGLGLSLGPSGYSPPNPSTGGSQSFAYNGDVEQSWIVPAGVTPAVFETGGNGSAKGGNASASFGVKGGGGGGYTKTTTVVTPGETIYINISPASAAVWFSRVSMDNGANSFCLANDGGVTGVGGIVGIGDITLTGGNGGSRSATSGGGGGGGAGRTGGGGNGGAGGVATGGTAGAAGTGGGTAGGVGSGVPNTAGGNGVNGVDGTAGSGGGGQGVGITVATATPGFGSARVSW